MRAGLEDQVDHLRASSDSFSTHLIDEIGPERSGQHPASRPRCWPMGAVEDVVRQAAPTMFARLLPA